MTGHTAARVVTTSESEEMYLITVARAAEEGRSGPIPVAAIAATLHVSVASANEMVRKLAARDLVGYEPYRGVSLTATGAQVANRVLRIRRLWATFLAEYLGFSPAEADAQACDLEHVTTPDAANRLADFLGDPSAGPLGHPIPPESSTTASSTVPLAHIGAGTAAIVAAVDHPDRIRAFLAAEGLVPAARLEMVATGASGMLVRIAGHDVSIDLGLAESIRVQPEAS